MHGLCSEGEANGTTLAKCPRDFVEAPSQARELVLDSRGTPPLVQAP
jgi:Zn-dependent oligopeptidase